MKVIASLGVGVATMAVLAATALPSAAADRASGEPDAPAPRQTQAAPLYGAAQCDWSRPAVWRTADLQEIVGVCAEWATFIAHCWIWAPNGEKRIVDASHVTTPSGKRVSGWIGEWGIDSIDWNEVRHCSEGGAGEPPRSP
ncbi:hypothetical protein ACTWP5_05605 [Streptomyces sp. 4N509B]|uniref:hypothetical protein n=1 Tax=Streptomyces sp. 4N509B TaxID=3457413 RepID=UPI003FD69759